MTDEERYEDKLYHAREFDKLYAYRRRKDAKAQGKYWCRGCDTIKAPGEFYARRQVSVKHTDHYSDCKLCSNERAKHAKRRANWDDAHWDLVQRKEEAREQGKKLCMACLKPLDPALFRRIKGHEDEPDPLKYRYAYCIPCHRVMLRRCKRQRQQVAA